jgi:hypothetical protein
MRSLETSYDTATCSSTYRSDWNRLRANKRSKYCATDATTDATFDRTPIAAAYNACDGLNVAPNKGQRVADYASSNFLCTVDKCSSEFLEFAKEADVLHTRAVRLNLRVLV